MKIGSYQTYKLRKDVHDRRENEMLQNIYDYSKEHSYPTAMFTIGAGHRKSMMQKIQKYERKIQIKLHWIFYTP